MTKGPAFFSTVYAKGTPINVCGNKKNLNIIEKDVLRGVQDVARSPIFSQCNLEGEMVTYQTVLCEMGTIYVVRVAEEEK